MKPRRKRKIVKLLGSFTRFDGRPPIPEVLMVLSAVRKDVKGDSSAP